MVALKGRLFTAKIMMFISCSLMMTNWDLWPPMFMEILYWWQTWKEILIKQLKLSLGTCIMKFYVLSLLNHPIKCCCTIFWLYLENPVRNMAAYRKSNKMNTRRKKTQFKKRHKFTSTLKESYMDNSSSFSVCSTKAQFREICWCSICTVYLWMWCWYSSNKAETCENKRKLLCNIWGIGR